jgi:RNA polymerase sigma-70 factor (ECF subfamily)
MNDPEESIRIARRLKERDPNAMADLYDAYGGVVHSRVHAMVQNAGVAEDLVQEVFLTVWQRAVAFDETRGSLSTWLLVMARNRAIDYLRSKESRVESKASPIELVPGSQQPLSPERDAIRFDMVARLKKAVTRLNLNQRTVLKLAFEEGLSHAEVSERLRRPLGTVKTQIRSAIQALRAEMTAC